MAELESFMQAGVLSGDIKAPPTAGQQYSGIFTTQDGRRAGLNNVTGQIEVIPAQGNITARAPEAAQQPASLQEMAWLNNPQRTPQELDMYWRNKRAEQIVALGGGGQGAVSPSGDTRVVVAPEDAAAREAAEAAAVKSAELTATAEGDAAGLVVKNQKLWAAYKTAADNYRNALAKAGTVPFGDGLKLTPAQQAATRARAQYGLALKRVTRDAGEGVFAKDDREAMMLGVPDIGDYEEARAASFDTIDSTVAAGLGIDLGAQGGGGQPPSGGFKVRSVK